MPIPESAAPATAGELLALIRSGRAATRTDLRALTGLSRTAITTRVASLVDAQLLLAGEELASTGGRPPGALVFNANAAVVLAAAIGRSRSQLAVCTLDGEEIVSSSQDHAVGMGPDELMPDLARRLSELLAQAPGHPRVAGVGVSLPGTVDPAGGASLDSPVMTGWDGVELAPYVREATDAPLFLGNDADVLARAERLGPHGALGDLLVVKASTGLGLGIVANGQVVSGHLGAAGEIGHTKVVAAAGIPCRCGDSGCLEAVAAGWALVAQVPAAAGVTHVRDLVALALTGDRHARALLKESGRRLGDVVSVAVNLLNPHAVIVGGDMAAAFDIYAAGLRESIYARCTALATRDLQILPASYGDRSGLVGCAALALDHVLSPAAVDALLASRT